MSERYALALSGGLTTRPVQMNHTLNQVHHKWDEVSLDKLKYHAKRENMLQRREMLILTPIVNAGVPIPGHLMQERLRPIRRSGPILYIAVLGPLGTRNRVTVGTDLLGLKIEAVGLDGVTADFIQSVVASDSADQILVLRVEVWTG